jgi:hypothetical protein
MANTIITKNSATATAVPTAGQLVQGELAVNVTDKRLFTENSGGTVVELGTNPSSVTTGGLTINNTAPYITFKDTDTTDNVTGYLDFRTSADVQKGFVGFNGAGDFELNNLNNNSINFSTTNVKRMDINSIGDISFYEDTGTTAKFFWDASAESLGIGTSSPPSYGATFTVVQASNSGSGVVQAQNTTNSVITEIESEGTRGAVGTRTNHDLAFKTNQTERMRLNSSGNVGIGTTSISGKLSINGEVYAAAGSVSGVAYGFYPKGTYGNTGMFSPAANTVAFATTGGERMRLDSSGNVGIGTSTIGTDGVSLNSAYNIGWTQSAGESVPNIFRQSSSAATVVANGYRYTATSNGFASSFSSSFAKSAISVGDGSVRFYTDTAATTAAGTDVTPTERLRIDSSGNLLVGTTSLYGGEKLALVQSTNNRGFVIQQTNASNTSPPFLIDCSRNTTNETYNALAYYNSGAGAYRFYVTDNGGGYFNGNLLVGTTTGNARLTIKEEANLAEADSHIEIVGSGYSGFHWLDGTAYYIGQNSSIREVRIYSGAETAGVVLGAGGTSWSTFSDERLKYDIQPINDGLTKLANIRCVSYRLKDVDAEDSQKKLGVIAQDLVGVVDEVISITKKTGDETDYMSVRYTELIPVLIKAIQEQQAIIESLKARLDAANI